MDEPLLENEGEGMFNGSSKTGGNDGQLAGGDVRIDIGPDAAAAAERKDEMARLAQVVEFKPNKFFLFLGGFFSSKQVAVPVSCISALAMVPALLDTSGIKLLSDEGLQTYYFYTLVITLIFSMLQTWTIVNAPFDLYRLVCQNLIRMRQIGDQFIENNEDYEASNRTHEANNQAQAGQIEDLNKQFLELKAVTNTLSNMNGVFLNTIQTAHAEFVDILTAIKADQEQAIEQQVGQFHNAALHLDELSKKLESTTVQLSKVTNDNEQLVAKLSELTGTLGELINAEQESNAGEEVEQAAELLLLFGDSGLRRKLLDVSQPIDQNVREKLVSLLDRLAVAFEEFNEAKLTLEDETKCASKESSP